MNLEFAARDIETLKTLAQQDGANIRALARIAEIHDWRVSHLEDEHQEPGTRDDGHPVVGPKMPDSQRPVRALPKPDRTARIASGIWMAAGIVLGAWKTRGFRGELVNFGIPAEDEACELQ